MTARTLIQRSLQLIGAVASGETPTADESNDALLTLNSLLESFHTQDRTLYTVTRVTSAIVASQASYTIGVSGNINRARPTGLTQAAILMTSATPDVEVPIQVLTQQEWERIAVKDLTSALPTAIYYNPTYPLGVLYPYPIGTDITVSLVLYVKEPVTTLATLDTALAYPPGYERMLRLKLAVELAVEYGRAPQPLLVQAASDAWSAIQRANLRPVTLCVDAALLAGARHRDIYSGD